MAEKRMFAKTIIDSDAFLDMPHTAQNLYFHLCMRADDEGFINKPKMIQRMVGCNDDDMKVLLSKKFIIAFESGVIVIKHWKIHNYIRKDRLVETMYKDERDLLSTDGNGAYTFDRLQEVIDIPHYEIDDCRKKAYEESSLPYSFSYKIKKAFEGKLCPVCGAEMSVGEFGIRTNIPTIQHNIPISKGGKHELGNISVICLHCNTTIKDEITGQLNSDEVVEEWDKICGSNQCQSDVSQVPVKCQHRLDKVRLDKSSTDNTVSKDTVRSTEVQRVVEEWNKLSDLGIKPVTKLTPGTNRYSWLKARINQYGIDEVIRAIQKVRNSNFLVGGSKRGWVITFDWFARPNNFPKVLDGIYDDKTQGSQTEISTGGSEEDEWQ